MVVRRPIPIRQHHLCLGDQLTSAAVGTRLLSSLHLLPVHPAQQILPVPLALPAHPYSFALLWTAALCLRLISFASSTLYWHTGHVFLHIPWQPCLAVIDGGHFHISIPLTLCLAIWFRGAAVINRRSSVVFHQRAVSSVWTALIFSVRKKAETEYSPPPLSRLPGLSFLHPACPSQLTLILPSWLVDLLPPPLSGPSWEGHTFCYG